MPQPVRVQRSRAKGWRMPPDTLYVGCPSQWGNPFPVHGDWIVWAAVALGFMGDLSGRRAAAVSLFRSWLIRVAPVPTKSTKYSGAIGYADGTEVPTSEHVQGFAGTVASLMDQPKVPAERPDLKALRGKDLACWCPLDQPCHADVLLEIANS